MRYAKTGCDSHSLEAIPTRYAGELFRSRLEARWAVFFDELDIDWGYEVDQYSDGIEFYTPDFWLPEFEYFVEIKPKNVYDIKKIKMLALTENREVFVAFEFPSPERTVIRSAHCWFSYRGEAVKSRGPHIWIDTADGITLDNIGEGWSDAINVSRNMYDIAYDISIVKEKEPEIFTRIDAASRVAQFYQFKDAS